MNKIIFKVLLPGCIILIGLYACTKKFLQNPLIGASTQTAIASKAGVERVLIGAYSMLDGIGAYGTGDPNTPGLTDGTGGIWETSADNWVYGSVAGGDDHKGSDPGDQPSIVPIQAYSQTSANLFFNDKWLTVYASVQRCNDVLRTMRAVTDGSMLPADTIQVTSEARFLRALFHFEAVKMWKNVPWVDESVTYAASNYYLTNTTSIWPQIEADLQYAIAHLPATQSDLGRVNSWAAKAFLAKAYMFELKYAQAYTLLKDIIANGVTAK